MATYPSRRGPPARYGGISGPTTLEVQDALRLSINWHAGGADWRNWYQAIRDELLARQRDDGAWMDSICQEYGTAMATIILQMPNNYLPIFQR